MYLVNFEIKKCVQKSGFVFDCSMSIDLCEAFCLRFNICFPIWDFYNEDNDIVML